jgi:hypothetical protein
VSATDVARYAAKPLSTPTKTPASNQSNAVAPNRAQQRARQERLQVRIFCHKTIFFFSLEKIGSFFVHCFGRIHS